MVSPLQTIWINDSDGTFFFVKGRFQVVGECYIHGSEDSRGILGPLPPSWTATIRGDVAGRPTPRYVNTSTDEEMLEDPRLGPLPQGCVRTSYERSADNPAILERFKNTISGRDDQLRSTVVSSGAES